MKMLNAAIKYAKNGLPIFPCSLSKRPITKKGVKEATTDISIITQWWTENPNASIGLATGSASGYWALDVDEPGGKDSLEKIISEYGPIPETLTQQTGGGGVQYFFSLNGRPIKNSASKIGHKIDVRGEGGYSIIPPSPHPSGNEYKWLNKTWPPCPAPEWLSKKAATPERKESPAISGPNSKYGLSALSQEIINLSCQSQGSRNETLNACAYALGQLVAGGELDENHVVNALLSTAFTIGLTESEATKTLMSGLKSGKENPRSGDSTNGTNGTNETNGTNGTTNHQRSLTETNGTNALPDHTNGRFQGNLTAEIRQFIQENQGSFTNADIDREFGLHHPADKNLRRSALARAKKERIIKSDRRVSGKYHIVTQDIEWTSLKNISDEYFPLVLPISLNKVVRIPPKCICVVAGTSNAGKTAFLLELAKINIHQKYGLMYLMSEMGQSEYLLRVKKVTDNLDEWDEKIKAASVSSGFDGPIAHHNPDGLTIIDYLEDVEGEYYKIASDIRNIYDALDNGVAWVALQKHTQARVGRGGEGTTEKARLYLTIDTLAHRPNCTISAVKIIKCKDYPGSNPNGKEIHVKVRADEPLEPITEWMYCNETQRKKYIQQYENMLDAGIEKDQSIYFTTISGANKRIKERDIKSWSDTFKRIDVEAELLKISEQSSRNPFLKDKDYFFQLASLLKKLNDSKIGTNEAPF